MGLIRTEYLHDTKPPLISICILFLIFVYLETSQHIGLHTRMTAYASAYDNVGRLCISLHTILCRAVLDTDYLCTDNYTLISVLYLYALLYTPLKHIGTYS